MTFMRGGSGRPASFLQHQEVIVTTDHPMPVGRTVFSFLVPVHVAVEDGLVADVVVIDETPIRDPELVEGDVGSLTHAVTDANNGQPWPSWRFGY